MLLNNRVCLIVGAGGALGRAIVHAYKREAAVVVAADFNREAALASLVEIGEDPKERAFQVDISDANACQQLIATVASKFGRLDVLVNCAAICLVDPLLDVTPERWEQVFGVNARGAFFLMQAAAKVMIPRKFGRIISVSSPASRMGFPNFATYSASKAVVDSITKAAAIAWAEQGVTVNCIVPGRMTGGMIDGLEQELSKIAGKESGELVNERTKGLPMRRRVAPEEVAEAAVWLGSDAANYVTAERFNFTGGMELS